MARRRRLGRHRPLLIVLGTTGASLRHKFEIPASDAQRAPDLMVIPLYLQLVYRASPHHQPILTRGSAGPTPNNAVRSACSTHSAAGSKTV